MNNKNIRTLVFILMVGILSSCNQKISAYRNIEAFKSVGGKPDYTKLEYWAAHPDKWDPSDSVPTPLRGAVHEKKVDVFFLHPTTLTELKDTVFINARIDDSILNYKTDYSSILYQASVFNENARIFAPRYRQAHIQMYFEKDSIKQHNAFELAYQDIKTAFEYYLKNENKGRPIIIASHSQGTTHAIRLLKEYFDNKELSKQLICGYLIGMGVKKNQYEQIKSCDDSTKTGCVISWRTYREDYKDGKINRKDTSILVTNPVTWENNNELVLRKDHSGAILYDFNKIFEHTQNVQAEGNALWISHPKFPGSIFYTTKNYHIGDINLFYVDIRKDVKRRIEYYYKSH